MADGARARTPVRAPSRLRALLRTLHLWLGLVAGLLFALLGVTGTVLTYQPELLRWQYPALFAQPVPDDAAIARGLERLLAAGEPAVPEKPEEGGAEKTEIWDAEILPHEGEDPTAFAAQHTVVQAGGFDAAMVHEAQARDEAANEQFDVPPTPVDAPAPPLSAGPSMRATPAHKQTQPSFPGESTRPGTNDAAAAPPRSLAVVGAVAGLLAITGVISVVASFAFGLGDDGKPAVAPPGNLVINVTPTTEIDVLIDGKVVANAAPVKFQNAPVGPHVVEVRAEDYLPFQKTVTVESGKTAPVDVTLERAVLPPGAMVLRLPDDRADVSIFVDGESKSYDGADANPSFEVTPGRHLFEIRRPGFRPWVRVTEIEPNVHKEEIVRFVAHDGPLEIDAPADAVVYWDRKRLGEGPQTIESVDRTEVHDLRVRPSGGPQWRSAIGFPQLGNAKLEVDLQAPTHRERDFGWLQASTGDDWWQVLIDGVDSGLATPITPSRKLPIAAGEHEVTFRRGDTRHDKKVTIEAGETLILSEPLTFE